MRKYPFIKKNKIARFILSLMIIPFLFLLLTGCGKEYTGKYVQWQEKTDSNATELLERNDIPYKITDGIIYIPEDAFDKAIYCCS